MDDCMPGRGTDLLVVPDSFWQRPETIAALRERSMGKLFVLIHEHTGATQTQIGTACGVTQPKISDIVRGVQKIEELAVFTRYADGLGMPDHARITLGLAPQAAIRAPRRRSGPSDVLAVADVVTATAEEVAAENDRLAAECDPDSLAVLWQESTEIARAANRPALEVFITAKSVRSAALSLAERTHRPGTLSDLYVICGQATALMASSAFDLNHWNESNALAKSAVRYASLAGHTSLETWTIGLTALLANWRREPDIALSHFQHGMQLAPPGQPRARLRYIASRSYALLDDIASVAEVLSSAQADQDESGRHPDTLSSEVGGEFAFGPARAAACAAAAWLDVGDGREARDAAQSALDVLTALPAPRRPLSQVNGARIDLATACLLSSDLDASAAALRPVLGQLPAVRNVSLAGRLARTRTTLLGPAWAKNGQARQLADEIGHWLATGEKVQLQALGQR
jgi:predicted XRE-type DNA-binding protein